VLKKLMLIPFTALLVSAPTGCGKSNDDVPKVVGSQDPNAPGPKQSRRGGFKAAGAPTDDGNK
jgi:hypothetical protein